MKYSPLTTFVVETRKHRKPLKHKGNPLNHLYDTTPIKKQIPIW